MLAIQMYIEGLWASFYIHCDIHCICFFYFNPPNVLLNSVTAEITLQGLEIHVVVIKHHGVGTRAPPVAMWCDRTNHNVVMDGGWVCTPVTASPNLCWSSCCQHVSCFISTQVFLFWGIFQKEGKRNGSKRFPCPFPQVSIQNTFSFLEQIFCCVVP